MGKKLTISLTDRRPVTVDVDAWAIIGQSSDHDNQYECQANRKWKMTVRQCQTEGDDRCVVYGTYTSQYQGEADRRGGEIVEDLDSVPEAVKRVAEYLGFDARLADECIADLPADEI